MTPCKTHNPIENATRPIALGRNNWLFAGSESAGKRVAAIMSLLATAKANAHDPHAWLTDVLTLSTDDTRLDSIAISIRCCRIAGHQRHKHTWRTLAR